MFNPFIILAVLLSLVIGFPDSAGTNATNCQNELAASDTSKTEGRSVVAEKVEFVRIYTISNGKLEDDLFMRENLEATDRLKVEGYVCGIVVLCDGDMNIDIDGQELSKIRKNEDGTFSLKYFGVLRPEELAFPNGDKAYYEKLMRRAGADQKDEPFLTGGYSYFPRINGDSVSPKSKFSVNFDANGQEYKMAIEQTGYSKIQTVSLTPDSPRNNVTFSYIGTRLQNLKKECPDFEKRLRAIAEGIDSVESAFDIDLVSDVNIIDFDDVYNAVSCEENNDIWFYSRTFESEPLEELRIIAAHETLHICVDELRLTRDSEIREFFAELKGFDDFSYERFLLVTRGATPPPRAGQGCADDILLLFINEKNFIEGMKGGHSQKNLEEFCTSFIHSLMYIDRLEHNLEQPQIFPCAGERHRSLSAAEKADILDNYIRGIEIMLQAVTHGDENGEPYGRKAEIFFRQSLRKATQLRHKLWASA